MKIEKWCPPKVTQLEVAHNNLIASRSDYLYFKAQEQECRMRLLNWRSFAEAGFGIELELVANGDAATLFLTQWPFNRLAANAIDAELMAALPADLRVAIAEIELEGLSEVTSALLHRPVEVRAVRTGGQITRKPDAGATRRATEDLWFLLETRTGTSTLGCLRPSPNLYRVLMGRVAEVGKVEDESAYDVPCPPRIEVAAVRLTHTQFESLQTGDVILLAEHLEPDRKPVRLMFGNGLRIIGVSTGESIMVEAVERAPSQASLSADDIDNLNVQLSFEVGTVGMSFGDLKAVRPGYTFVTERRIDRVVHIRCNGKLIGIGELVQVDERSGVRVLEIFGFKHG